MNYQIICQAIAFGVAMFWSFAYINRALTFYVKGMKNQDANIPPIQIIHPSIAWAIFFWLMNVQF